jgi:hypothetical protein
MDTLEDLDYADDVCLLSHSHRDVQNTVMYFQKEARKAGLQINVDTTKELRVNEKTITPVVLGTKNIESVQRFTHLGGHVSRDGGTLGNLDRRIQKAKGAFARSTNIWRSNKISLKTKIKIFSDCVESVLLYGCQT